MQGEHLVLAAFARCQYVLVGEETSEYGGKKWEVSGHDLDFVFEKGGIGYGVEVKNTLGYLDVIEFVTKIRMCLYLGLKPVFAVRYIPKTWIEALIEVGGYAMIMGHQFYPWTHADLAREIRENLSLPVDTPRRIEAGTMQRFENWAAKPQPTPVPSAKVERLLKRIVPGEWVVRTPPKPGET